MSSTTYQHHHQSGWYRLIAPFRAAYRRWYIPLLSRLGNALGGRARAGRMGRASRTIRVLGNLLTLSAIIAVILLIGVSTFWTGGAALPLWATILVTVGIAFNSVGLMIGAAGNHLKIEQYFQTDIELDTLINELGSDESNRGKTRKAAMLGVRYAHDVNGVAGSGVSLTANILEAISWLSAGLISFEPIIGSILFVVSRASALVSATGAMGTNQHRLWVYKKNIHEKIISYNQLKETKNPERHARITTLVKNSFTRLNINKEHKYTQWVEFRCYKAIDQALGNPPSSIENAAIEEALVSMLTPYLTQDQQRWQGRTALAKSSLHTPQRFSRHALMNMTDSNGLKLSVLDSMPLLENCLFNAVYAKVNPARHVSITNSIEAFTKHLAKTEDTTTTLLIANLKQSLSGLSLPNMDENTLYNALTGQQNRFFTEKRVGETVQYELDKIKVADYFPLPNNPHGNQFLVDYHTKKVAQAICAQIKQPLTDNGQQTQPAAAAPTIMVSTALQSQNISAPLPSTTSPTLPAGPAEKYYKKIGCMLM